MSTQKVVLRVVLCIGLLLAGSAARGTGQNYEACLNGYGLVTCDPSQLTPVQQAAVAKVDRQRNYEACLHGYGLVTCDSLQLTLSQQTAVAKAERRRNYEACLHGYGLVTCDPSQLTTLQQAAVAKAERRRNYEACLHGYGLVACDPSQLTTQQQAASATADRQRNYDACLHGYGLVTCDPLQLTPRERLALSRPSPTPPRSSPASAGLAGGTGPRDADPAQRSAPSYRQPETASTFLPGCAENGSCYGDPNVAGFPKTVFVNGYYRKDGTYVRSHYRSRPHRLR
jgi:hypothetical protein